MFVVSYYKCSISFAALLFPLVCLLTQNGTVCLRHPSLGLRPAVLQPFARLSGSLCGEFERRLFAGCVAVKWTESTEPVGLRWRASKNFDGGKTVSTSLRLYTVKNRPTTDTQSVTILSWKWPPGKITGKKHELCKVA